MFTKLIKKVVVVAAFCFSMSSSAGVIVDTIDLNKYVGFWQNHSYFHNINDNGFNLGTAISGSLAINVYDDNRNDCFGFCSDLGEIILYTVEAFDFDTGAITFGNLNANLGVNALAEINSDGFLDMKISSLFGDFYIGSSVLTINTVEVAEPASFALLALGLIGLGFARRTQTQA